MISVLIETQTHLHIHVTYLITPLARFTVRFFLRHTCCYTAAVLPLNMSQSTTSLQGFCSNSSENSLQVFLLSEAEKREFSQLDCAPVINTPWLCFHYTGITLWHHKYSLNFSKSTKTNHISLRSPDHHYPAWHHCQHSAWYSSSVTSRGTPLVQQFKDWESPSQGGRLEWVSHRTFPPKNWVCIQFLTTSQEKLAFKLCNIRRWTSVNDCLM